jgi:hypothetical protein
MHLRHVLHCHSHHGATFVLQEAARPISSLPQTPSPPNSPKVHLRAQSTITYHRMTKSKPSKAPTGATIKDVTTLLSKAQPFLEPAQEILSLTSTAVKDLQKPANKSKAKKAKVVIALAKQATAVASEASTKHKEQKALKKDVREDEIPLLQEHLEAGGYYGEQRPGEYYYDGGRNRGKNDGEYYQWY